MFQDRHDGPEQLEEFASDHPGVTGVQPLRVKPLHFQGGSWVIPSIHPDVPLTIQLAGQQKAAAAFSLQAHANGMSLPGGTFKDLQTTLLNQLQKFTKKSIPKNDPLNMRVHFTFSDEQVEIVLLATEGIKTIKLAPTVNRLNDAHEGLGWFVYECLERSVQNGFPIYSPSHMACLMEMLWFDAGMTDEEYAEHLSEQYSPDEIEGMSDQDVIDNLGCGITPSMVASDFGDLNWVFGAGTEGNSLYKPKPRIPAKAEVEKVVNTLVDEGVKEIVAAALSLDEEVSRKSSHLKTHQASLGDEYGYEPNAYGASCILVWDEVNVAYELIQNYEETEMNGGEATEVHMVFRGDPGNQESMDQLVQSFKDVIARYQAVGNLLKHFL